MKKEIIFTFLVLFAVVGFFGFVWYHEKVLQNNVQSEIEDCARVVSNSVWNYEDKLPLEYLALTSRKNNFNKISITMREGGTFIELDNQITNSLDKFLINLSFTYHLTLISEISYNNLIIGHIKAEWYPLAIYSNIIVLLFVSLMLVIAWYYLKFREAADYLEQRVSERTVALIKTNEVLENEILKRETVEHELIKSKEKSEELYRLKSALLTNMSHEIRTPMNGILGLAAILSEKLTAQKYADMAQKIYRSGIRLMNTLGSILDLSELESNTIQVNMTGYNISANIKKILKQYQNIANDKNLYFRYEINNENAIAYVDERICNHIILNLIDNAIKYTEEGGITVFIDVEKNEKTDNVIFSVKDTGIGIAKHNKEIIYEEFRQLSEGFSRSYEGTGLGLSLVKKMLLLFNGVIELESEVGIGSTFTIKFPGVTESCMPVEEAIAAGYETTGGLISGYSAGQPDTEKLPFALLVEDNAINREITEIFLKPVCRVESASNGKTALDMAGKKAYSLVLLDINLGHGIDGVITASEIKKIKGYENVPMVALTGYAMSSDKDKFLSEGFSHYLAKPFGKEELIYFINSILAEIKL